MKSVKPFVKTFYHGLIRSISLNISGLICGLLNRSEINEIMILRLDGIGDTVLFSAGFEIIRKKYPNYKISIVVIDYVMPLLINCPYIDEIIPFKITQQYNLVQRIKILVKLKKRKIHTIIYPMWTRNELGDDICKLINPNELIMFNLNDNGIKNSNCVLVEIPQSKISELKRNEILIKSLLPDEKISDISPRVFLNKEEENVANKIIEDNNLKEFIVIVPGAGEKIKIWSTQKWIDLISNLLSNFNYNILLLGGKSDTQICNEIFFGLSNKRIYNFVSEFSLNVNAAIVKCSKLYIGSDTGLLHIASAVSTPAVCIMGGGHFGRFFPYDGNENQVVYYKMDCFNCNWKCIYDTPKCIDNITEDNVFEKVSKMIEHIEKEVK